MVRVFALALFVFAPALASAQEPPPRIGPFVIDLHGTFPRFPDDPVLAGSRAMSVAELPGAGLGIQVGVHVYPLRWRAVTFGLGGELATTRARRDVPEGAVIRGDASEAFTVQESVQPVPSTGLIDDR